MAVCVCMCVCRLVFSVIVLSGRHADARLPQRDQIMIYCGSLRGGCGCNEGGWSVSLALTFITEIRHSWRQQMRLWPDSCQLEFSHSAIVWSAHTHMLTTLYYYLYVKLYWFKTTNVCCMVWRVYHCNQCRSVIKSSSVSRDLLPLWRGRLMWPSQTFGELFVYSFFLPPPPPFPRWPLNQNCPQQRFMMKTSKDL